MVVAGEASGDLHGATLCRALRTLAPECRLYGMGGRRMAEAGMDVLVDVTAGAVVGWSEALNRVPMLYRAFRRLRRELTTSQPAALVLIDFPEFNFRLARAARRAGIPVVYFIPPQIWAWRPGRVKTIRRLVSLVLAVLPFELDLYRRNRVPVEFVGHPVLDALVDAPSRDEARRQLRLPDGAPVIGLLPGSRREEVERILPAMRDACRRIAASYPSARFVLGLAPTIDRAQVDGASDGVTIDVAPGGAYAVMRAADLVLVTSGTATLEAALLGAPMIVCYRLSRLSEILARFVIRVPWISLANITLGRGVVPELYRATTVTGERLASEALRLLGDRSALEAQRAAFGELATQLGEPGVGLRAARAVLGVAHGQQRTSALATPAHAGAAT